jgi:F-type H+-transporting ATPase subunit epsilon
LEVGDTAGLETCATQKRQVGAKHRRRVSAALPESSMAATLKLEIVTPEAKTYSEDVESVTLPGIEGEMGVFPQHVPLMTQIVSGEIAVRKGGQDYFLAVGEGFVEITAERVAVLTDMAIRAEQIDEAKAEEARQRAQARLSEHIDDEEAARVNASLAQALAQIRVKRRHLPR